MSASRKAAEWFRNAWGMGEEDDYEEELESQSHQSHSETLDPNSEEADYERVESRTISRTVYAPTASATSGRRSPGDDESAGSRPHSSQRPDPGASGGSGSGASGSGASGGGRSGGGSASGARVLRSVAMPLRARDKNIYTLKPKTMDEASLAADYLKTGCAVVVNLQEVERMVAVRIIDFMSGVCYGLENQGHAMKLGDIIFLFTPGDFEITSDEVDYGENPHFIFKEETQTEALKEAKTDGASERRSWER